MGLPAQWNDNGDQLTRPSGNRHNLPTVLNGLLGMSLAELKALTDGERESYTRIKVDGKDYVWNADSTLSGDDLLVVEPDDGSDGRFLLAPNQEVQLSMPITFETADAAALLTVPAGALLLPRDFWWTISADFTGGASSAIGVSTDHTGYDTKGDFLGGATGDLAAALTAALSPTFGTIGGAWTTLTERQLILQPAEIVRFDRITSAFTAGSGNVEMIAYVLANAGS
jgi:hypothetical protein